MDKTQAGKLHISQIAQRSPPNLSYRPFGHSDINLCYAWAQDEELVRYLPSMPRPLLWVDHEGWALRAMQHLNREDFMIDAVSPYSESRLSVVHTIGRVHATNITLPNPEVGVFVGDKSMWGIGVATEAIGWMMRWLREHGPWFQCHALIHPENIASIKAFEKNGFIKRTDGAGLNELGRGGQLVFDKVLRP